MKFCFLWSSYIGNLNPWYLIRPRYPPLKYGDFKMSKTRFTISMEDEEMEQLDVIKKWYEEKLGFKISRCLLIKKLIFGGPTKAPNQDSEQV